MCYACAINSVCTCVEHNTLNSGSHVTIILNVARRNVYSHLLHVHSHTKLIVLYIIYCTCCSTAESGIRGSNRHSRDNSIDVDNKTNGHQSTRMSILHVLHIILLLCIIHNIINLVVKALSQGQASTLLFNLLYHIARKFGGELNLVVWRYVFQPPN